MLRIRDDQLHHAAFDVDGRTADIQLKNWRLSPSSPVSALLPASSSPCMPSEPTGGVVKRAEENREKPGLRCNSVEDFAFFSVRSSFKALVKTESR
jgi:hypothetical protein